LAERRIGMSRLRWSLGLAAAVGALAWLSGTPGGGDLGDAARAARQAAPATRPADQKALELPQRGLSARRSDLFPPANLAAPRKPEPVALPEAPKAPPLPYKYDGSGEVQGKRFVYLAREGTSSAMVGVGDTLDGTYRVENIARDYAVLRYLPLGTQQVLMYQPGAEAPPELTAASSTGRPLELQVEMPAEVVLGNEFLVTVVVSGGGALKATIEVGYDPEVLTMVGAGLPRPGGRAVVEAASGSAPRAQLRFKVLADTPTATDIALRVNATDASGKRVPVWTPGAHTVSLVQPGA
jgi:hypothetical protein